ncbi:hypothetical protein FOCC_FOCC000876, partial [Frankliniella occidentalis]
APPGGPGVRPAEVCSIGVARARPQCSSRCIKSRMKTSRHLHRFYCVYLKQLSNTISEKEVSPVRDGVASNVGQFVGDRHHRDGGAGPAGAEGGGRQHHDPVRRGGGDPPELVWVQQHARAACPRLQDEEDDVWENIMGEIMASTGRRDEAVAAEQVDDVLDWGVFIGWAPVPTLEEAEVLAAAAAAEEQQRREAAALKKAARLAKYHHNNGSFKRKYHYYQ